MSIGIQEIFSNRIAANAFFGKAKTQPSATHVASSISTASRTRWIRKARLRPPSARRKVHSHHHAVQRDVGRQTSAAQEHRHLGFATIGPCEIRNQCDFRRLTLCRLPQRLVGGALRGLPPSGNGQRDHWQIDRFHFAQASFVLCGGLRMEGDFVDFDGVRIGGDRLGISM